MYINTVKALPLHFKILNYTQFKKSEDKMGVEPPNPPLLYVGATGASCESLLCSTVVWPITRSCCTGTRLPFSGVLRMLL